MKYLSRIIVCLIAALVLSSAAIYAQGTVTPEWEAKATELIQKTDELMLAKKFDECYQYFHKDFCHVLTTLNRDTFIQMIKLQFEKVTFTEYKTDIVSMNSWGEFICVKIKKNIKWKSAAGNEGSDNDNYVYLLKLEDKDLKIFTLSQNIDEKNFDAQTRTYRSAVGGYSLTIPQGWLPLVSESVKAMAPDNVLALAPDGTTVCMLGFVKIPLNTNQTDPAKLALEADDAATKNLFQNYTELERGPITINGLTGYKSLTTFNMMGERKRMRLYFSKDKVVYFFICDAIPATHYDQYKQNFEQMVMSFKLLAEGDITTEEKMAAEYAQGSISGQTYTNKDFNCFIAAPPSWKIRTSPNPAHLVEIQQEKGTSLVRLIAAKDLMGFDNLDQLVDKRKDEIKGVVKNFMETGRNKITIQNVPAVVSIQKFTLDQLGSFEVKEVSLIKDGKFYLILCQAISPETLKDKEKDFDAIINSFGFIK